MDQFYKASQIADMFQVTPATVREWLKNGTIKSTKINGQWRVSESDLREFAQKEHG
jgi:excisionase family DNA binding protein